MSGHLPVMLNEVLAALAPRDGARYVDGTFGGGGYASAILRQALQLASELGLRRALLTCDDDNRGSIKVIERNGGVLENVITDADLATPKRRYWIRLAP